jgi:uncharacterized protein YkuJ
MTDDLRFAGKYPVVINRNGGSTDVFSPIKSSSCDITVVSNKILSDIYTNDKKGIKVKVEKVWNEEGTQNSTLFEGYMTPNSYSQKLSPNLDNIDMTAIDPLALLKYIYVDDLMEKSKSLTIGDLIGSALAAVKIDCNEVWIETNAEYGTGEGREIVNLIVQTNNFWDEAGDPSSVYDMLAETLRLFGYTMTFTGTRYMIYDAMTDHTFGTTYRYFGRYRIEDGGTLHYLDNRQHEKSKGFFQHSAGDWTTIDDNTTISIDNTYDKITGVASTKIPNYSLTAFDLVSSDERDKYDAGDVNIQRNKIKGYDDKAKVESETHNDDEWYYIWNGVYINDDYELDIKPDRIVNGYININAAYKYLSGQTGHPSAYGGILNFYGGEDNPIGTGKDQVIERPVDVKECITVFAPDNGTPPEFLEREDLKWDHTASYTAGEGENAHKVEAVTKKVDASNSKYGTNKTGIADAVSYRQKYENITVSKEADQTLVIDLSQSYSRTGIKQNINILDYSNMENKLFTTVDTGDGENTGELLASLRSGTAYTYPWMWQSSNIKVDFGYFGKYGTSKKLKPVWDRRKIVVSLILNDGTKYQFNGKDWVEVEYISDATAFYLKKMMNNEYIFRDDFTYDIIECGDGDCYSLNEEEFKYWLDDDTGSLLETGKDKDAIKYPYYKTYGYDWIKYIDEAEEGRLAIILPPIDSYNATVCCDIYHSSLLGMTGNSGHGCPSNTSHHIKYSVSGQVVWYEPEGNDEPHYSTLTSSVANYKNVGTSESNIGWMPVNGTYVKAEHLDLDISLSVPESNLGQMFGESDIKYSTNHSKKFREAYDAPAFKVNTKHPIVAQSHSYIIAGNSLAEPTQFRFGWHYNKIACRPENYVMQGYKNYWGVIRRTYNRVLVPNKAGFSNCLCYIEAPDIPDVGNGRWLMVVSDSWDVKTNRHTISAVEDYDLNVKEIENYTVMEIPREARNPRFNLPSVQKRTKTT